MTTAIIFKFAPWPLAPTSRRRHCCNENFTTITKSILKRVHIHCMARSSTHCVWICIMYLFLKRRKLSRTAIYYYIMYVGGTANICHSSDVLFMDVCVLLFRSFRGVDELQIIIHYYCYRRYYHHTRQRPRSGGLSWWHLYYRVHICMTIQR